MTNIVCYLVQNWFIWHHDIALILFWYCTDNVLILHSDCAIIMKCIIKCVVIKCVSIISLTAIYILVYQIDEHLACWLHQWWERPSSSAPPFLLCSAVLWISKPAKAKDST